jgi:hypothetical protein
MVSSLLSNDITSSLRTFGLYMAGCVPNQREKNG